MRRWKDLTELYKVTSNEHCENWIPNIPKWGTKKIKKNQIRSKLYLAFELYYKKESSVKTL